MPHESGSLDNSDRRRLCIMISSLVAMPAEEDIYVLYASATEFLDEMLSSCMETVHCNKMLEKAFDSEEVGALNTVIRLLRAKLAARQGGPAAAAPSPYVPAPAPPGELGSSSASSSSHFACSSAQRGSSF